MVKWFGVEMIGDKSLTPEEIVKEEVARQAEFGMEPSWQDFVIAGMKAQLTKCQDVCPECSGLKTIAREDFPDGEFYRRTQFIPCPTCKGTGKKQEREGTRQIVEYLKGRWNGTQWEGYKVVAIPDKDWQELMELAEGK